MGTKKYTLSEFKSSVVDILNPNATEDNVRTVAKMLGITIIPEGVTYLDSEKSIIVVSEDGTGSYIKADGTYGGYLRGDDIDRISEHLIPAITVPKQEWFELVQKTLTQEDVIRDLRKAKDQWAEQAYKAREETRTVARHLCKED